MAGSLKFGEATASLIVGKWSAASRQNSLATALKEWGTLRRTIHAAKYLSDSVYRRKISRQLNKGESLHALRRDLHYANQGTVGTVYLEQQGRAGVMSDRPDERRGDVVDGVLLPRGGAAARPGP